ncbi:DUF4959 domain-containing protein [Niabella sp. CC-SYL272]|uniref:DUF5126 domain-containing protein n=1 Tax=Niabella agricola TaxID=2891571 RepID=UPI001F329009|nr:DUF4959 domain-containing protein [Niabella agricola]MCF3108745.1 DUF4959 domain-containing protein [Niabella agricola]
MNFLMKKYSFIIGLIVLGLLYACRKEKEKTPGVWNSAPVTVSSITPINGGAIIAYDVPKEDNLLYVMVEYERNGQIFTEKSSVYKNTLRIEGFNLPEHTKVKAKVYKVNKQEQRSESTEVEFEPMEGLVSLAKKSIRLQPGFGGIVANWENQTSTELGLRLLAPGEIRKDLETKEVYFTTVANDKHAFRGFDPEPTDFALTFEDKWGNTSDTIRYSTTPFYETVIPKPYADYRANIPYDNTTTLSGKPFSSLWDNVVNTSGHGWLTTQGSSGLSITFDMKQVVKLSRIVIHGYHVNSPYGQVNIQQFEAWGTDKIDFSKLPDRPYWLDSLSVRWGAIAGVDPTTVLPATSFKNDWQYLGWHAIPRYDLMVPPDQQAIANISANGTEYEMPIDAKPVRYVRIFVRQVGNMMPPPSNNYFSMGEITFYGDNTVPQN